MERKERRGIGELAATTAIYVTGAVGVVVNDSYQLAKWGALEALGFQRGKDFNVTWDSYEFWLDCHRIPEKIKCKSGIGHVLSFPGTNPDGKC